MAAGLQSATGGKIADIEGNQVETLVPVYEKQIKHCALAALILAGVSSCAILGSVVTVAVRSMPSIWGLPHLLTWLTATVLLAVIGVTARRMPGHPQQPPPATLTRIRRLSYSSQLVAIFGIAVSALCTMLPFLVFPWGVKRDKDSGMYVRLNSADISQNDARVRRADADRDFGLLMAYAAGPVSCVFYAAEMVITSMLVYWCRQAEASHSGQGGAKAAASACGGCGRGTRGGNGTECRQILALN